GFVGFVFGIMMFTIVGIGLAFLLLVKGIDGVLRSQKWLRLLAGLIVSAVFWQLARTVIMDPQSMDRTTNIEFIVISEAVIAALALITSIAAAYATDNWQNWLREKNPRKVKRQPQAERIQLNLSDVSDLLFDRMSHHIRWIMYLTPLVAMFYTILHSLSYTVKTYELVMFPVTATFAFWMYLLCEVSLISASVSAIIMVANRYLFTVDTDPHIYKRNLSILTFLLVLPTQLVVALGIGAPLAVFIATLAVRDYADWYAMPAKAKRLQKKRKIFKRLGTEPIEAPILETDTSPIKMTKF
ncbi:MAG: hypothetical protein KC615_15360, partial [Anaerolineae bacterium]|nr:hypothetical protein [Anaerolineae bacterium]